MASCSAYSISPWPASETTVRYYYEHAYRTISHPSIMVYLAAIQHGHLERPFGAWTQGPPHRQTTAGIPARLRLAFFVYTGLLNCAMPCRTGPARLCKGTFQFVFTLTLQTVPCPVLCLQCWPTFLSQCNCSITAALLADLKIALNHSSTINTSDKLAMWAALTLGFYGFLLAGEFTTNHNSNYQPSSCRYLLLKDMVLKAGHYSVTIKGSKTDQERRSARILVGTTGTSTCPVQAMWAFLRSAKHPRSTPPLYPVFWTVPYTHQAHDPPTLTVRGHRPHTQAGWPLQQPQPKDWCGNRSSSRGAAHLVDPEGWTLAK